MLLGSGGAGTQAFMHELAFCQLSYSPSLLQVLRVWCSLCWKPVSSPDQPADCQQTTLLWEACPQDFNLTQCPPRCFYTGFRYCYFVLFLWATDSIIISYQICKVCSTWRICSERCVIQFHHCADIMGNTHMKRVPVLQEDASYRTTVMYVTHHWLKHHCMAHDCPYKDTFVLWIVIPFTGPTHLDFDLLTPKK